MAIRKAIMDVIRDASRTSKQVKQRALRRRTSLKAQRTQRNSTEWPKGRKARPKPPGRSQKCRCIRNWSLQRCLLPVLPAILVHHHHRQTLCKDPASLQGLADDLCQCIQNLHNLLLKATLIPGSKALLLSKRIWRPKWLNRVCIVADSKIRETQGIHTQ
jgi:hypothetical protein